MFYALIFGFVVGVWFLSLFSWGWAIVGWCALMALAFFLLGRKTVIVLFFLGAALGAARMLFLPQISPTLLAQVGQEVKIEGMIAEEPEARETYQRLVVKTATAERILIQTSPYPKYNLGDQVTIAGKLAQPKPFATNNSREFDYPGWLSAQNIFLEMRFAQIELVASAQNFWWRRHLAVGKRFFLNKVEEILPEPQAALLGGLLLGAKQTLGADWLEKFRRTGVSHMIVLSGYNLAIVAEALRWLFGFLPFYFGLGIAGFSIVGFALLAGGGAAATRAALMALIALFARATGRVYDAARALFLAALAMIIYQPRVLIFDLGFQLSFLATLGLIYLAPVFELKLKFMPTKFGLRSITATTFAAQISVLPWILYKMGNFSLVAPLVNPLVLVLVPAIMLFGFLASILAMVSFWLALPMTALTYLFLSYQLFVIDLFSRLSFASFTFSSFPLALTLAIYFSLIYWRRRSLLYLISCR